MKKLFKTRIFFALLSVAIFATFTQCNKMEEYADGEVELGSSSGFGGVGGGGAPSAAQRDAIATGFQNTIYSVTSNSANACVNCHNATVPTHAHPNHEVAMDEVLKAELVNFDNPSASRIIDKIGVEKHNCSTSGAVTCDSIARDLTVMVTAWVDTVKANSSSGSVGGGTDPDPVEETCTPSIIPITIISGGDTGGTGLTRRQAFDQEVFPIMQNTACANCHLSGRQPFHSSNVANTAYAAWDNNDLANLANIDQSAILTKIAGTHQGFNMGSEEYSDIRNAIISWNNNIDPNAGMAQDQTVIERQYDVCESFEDKVASMNSIADEAAEEERVSGGNFPIAQARLTAPFLIVDDYIHNPNAHANYPITQQNTGKAQYDFEVFAEGNYEVVADVWSSDGSTDSFYVAVTPRGTEPLDNATDYTEWRFGDNMSQYVAEEVIDQATGMKKLWALAPGQYTLTIKERENFARVRNVVIRPEGADSPVTVNAFKEMQFSLAEATGVEGAMLTFRLEDYDENSYKISDVRIKGGQNIYVKNLKILINDRYFPGNATYTLVDHLVQTEDDQISPFALIMLKVNGMGDVQDTDPVTGDPLVDENGDPEFKDPDVLSLEFETLVLTDPKAVE